MRKRARNHKHYVYCEKADKFFKKKYGFKGVTSMDWKVWAYEMHQTYDASRYNYEPQGKHEARKFFAITISKGLVDI